MSTLEMLRFPDERGETALSLPFTLKWYRAQ
jgi:hypothetical protein